MTRISYLLPFAGMGTDEVLAFARAVRRGPVERLWQGQTSSADPSHAFALAAGAGLAVPAGLGVTLAPLRHPFDAAVQARSLVACTGKPVVAGFGPGSRSFQQALRGEPYRSPLTAMREYLSTVRALVGGGPVRIEGEYVRFDGALGGAALPVEVGAGVLRPAMAHVAGACADVAITWMTPADYVGGPIATALRAGAAEADREPPRVVVMIGVALAGPDADLPRLVMAAHGRHLRQEHYRAMLGAAGVGVPARFRDLAAAVADGGAFLHGHPDQVADALDRFAAAGVDEIVLNLAASCAVRGVDAALAEAEAITRSFLGRATSSRAVSRPSNTRSTTEVLHATTTH
nr:LLM class flavin-dependent oxidoreductase [uncultured Actinotalea sp.]